jgi:broad specificity phosphatase PhoE
VRLYLIRHGESQGNAERRLQGRVDLPLTPRGHRQARALAQRLAVEQIAALYASPLSRARQTADAIAGRLGLEVVTDDRLMEYDLGPEISGLTWADVQEKYPDIAAALTGDESDAPRFPGEEGRAAFESRVHAAVDDITARNPEPGETAAVVTHGGPIFALVARALGRRADRTLPLHIDNTSLTVLEVREPRIYADVVLASLNDTCHLHGLDAEQPPALDVVAETGEVPA